MPDGFTPLSAFQSKSWLKCSPGVALKPLTVFPSLSGFSLLHFSYSLNMCRESVSSRLSEKWSKKERGTRLSCASPGLPLTVLSDTAPRKQPHTRNRCEENIVKERENPSVVKTSKTSKIELSVQKVSTWIWDQVSKSRQQLVWFLLHVRLWAPGA